MKLTFLFFVTAKLSTACPFSNTADVAPDDKNHGHLKGARRNTLSSLGDDPEVRTAIAAIIEKRSNEHQRFLQAPCADRTGEWRINGQRRDWCAWARREGQANIASRCQQRSLSMDCPVTCNSCPTAPTPPVPTPTVPTPPVPTPPVPTPPVPTPTEPTPTEPTPAGPATVTIDVYDSIRNDVVSIAQAINNRGQRGHFFGGIVRLAAHDFMDFDQNAVNNPNSFPLGPDGCLDFAHPVNAGLSDLWCDNPTACPLKALYDTSYSFISKADFWVAAANGVIQHTSNNRLVLPYRWGRLDNTVCSESSLRLPEAHGCSEVEATFLDRMGLTWRDAVALMGAHTLGRGDIRFSGHDGTWVDSDQESTVFDKRYYEEVLRRSWRPRQTAAGVNWTWGGNNRGVMMLNTDICLFFDIPDGNNQNCCTDTDGDCRDNNVQGRQCRSANNVRPQAVAAFEEFLGGTNLNNNNQQPFYTAFSASWTLATEIGYSDDSLFDLVNAPTTPTPPVPTPPVPTPTAPTPTAPTPTSTNCNEETNNRLENLETKVENIEGKVENIEGMLTELVRILG